MHDFFVNTWSLFEDEWFADVWNEFGKIVPNTINFPPTDICVEKETGAAVYKLAIAGYNPDNITITTDDNKIIVEGKGTKPDDKVESVVHGIKSSDFKTMYTVTSKFDLTKISASFKDGILTMTVPVSEERKPKKISITK